MRQQGPREVQHGQMQSPAPHLEQLPATVGNYHSGSSSAEKSLRVPVSNMFNMSQQCAPTGMKANPRLGWIGKCVTSRSSEVILPLFSALVRLHMGNCVQFGLPSARKMLIES